MFKKLREKLAARPRYRSKPDSKPLALPINFQRPPTLQEQVRRLVSSEHMRLYAQNQGKETWEESNDFDVNEEEFSFEAEAPHELVHDETLDQMVPKGQKARMDQYRNEFDNEWKRQKSLKKTSPPRHKFEEEEPMEREEKPRKTKPRHRDEEE